MRGLLQPIHALIPGHRPFAVKAMAWAVKGHRGLHVMASLHAAPRAVVKSRAPPSKPAGQPGQTGKEGLGNGVGPQIA